MGNVIDVGEYVISKNINDSFTIYGLSSCIGLVMYCACAHILGVAHILLPSSDINTELSKISPAYFADTGVTAMVNEFNTHGCKRENIIAGIYGGADSKSSNDVFNIGARNITAVISKINEHKINLKTTNTGGRFSRTLKVDVKTGNVMLNIQSFL